MAKITNMLIIFACAFTLSLTMGCGKDASEATSASLCEDIKEKYEAAGDDFDPEKCAKISDYIKEHASKEEFTAFAQCVYGASDKKAADDCGKNAYKAAQAAALKNAMGTSSASGAAASAKGKGMGKGKGKKLK